MFFQFLNVFCKPLCNKFINRHAFAIAAVGTFAFVSCLTETTNYVFV